MTHEDIPYQGDNTIPKGFPELANFLAERFDCKSFIPNEETLKCEIGFKEGDDPRMHIAGYSRKVCDLNEYNCEISNGLWTKQEIEQDYKRVSKQLRHDLEVFVSLEPEFANPHYTLESNGIILDMDSILTLKANAFDAKTILAMLIFVSRSDRSAKGKSRFLQCTKDGTFKNWLGRYAELVEYPYR